MNFSKTLHSQAGRPVWKSDSLTRQVALACEAEWSDLAANAMEKNIFTFPWFVTPSVTLLTKNNPEIIRIYDNGLLIGLLVVEEDRGYAKLPFSFRRTALHPDQFLGTPLVREGYADQFAAGLCAWLDAAHSKNCFLLLPLMSFKGPVSAAIAKVCAAQKRQMAGLDDFHRAAIIPEKANQKETDKHLSASRRKSLSRKWKNLAKQGPVEIEKLSREEDFDPWFADFLNMENSGWKREEESSILSTADKTDFYRQMIRSAFQRGSLNFFRLCVGDKPIAYTLDIISAPQAFCVKCAFDQEYRKYSPGVLMEYEALKYYHQQTDFGIVDSCTDPENAMLNELWPDRRSIVTLAIARRGAAYKFIFAIIFFLKKMVKKTGRGAKAFEKR